MKESYESTNKDFSKGRRRGSLYAEIKLNFLREDQLISLLKKENIIKPAIAKKKIVICDRFIDSTLAYQVYGKGVSKNLVDFIHKYISFSC